MVLNEECNLKCQTQNFFMSSWLITAGTTHVVNLTHKATTGILEKNGRQNYWNMVLHITVVCQWFKYQ